MLGEAVAGREQRGSTGGAQVVMQPLHAATALFSVRKPAGPESGSHAVRGEHQELVVHEPVEVAGSDKSGSTNDSGNVPGRSSLGRGLGDETVRQSLSRPARPALRGYAVLHERHRA